MPCDRQNRDITLMSQLLPIGLNPARHPDAEPLAGNCVAVLHTTKTDVPQMDAAEAGKALGQISGVKFALFQV
jgi:hypothetical protein